MGKPRDRKILLGTRIKEIRKKRGLSQEKLAERAGISAQYVSNIERGKENPTLDMLFLLADTLRVQLGEMCDFEAEGLGPAKARNAIRQLIRTSDQEGLKIAMKVLKAVLG